MKKSSKTFICVMLIFLTLPLYSCKNEKKYYDELKKRFAQYTPDYSVVTVLDPCFYFTDHTLDLDNLVEGEDPNRGYLFLDRMLYFSTCKQTGFRQYSLRVYKCDLYGNGKSLIFEKLGYKTHPWVTGNGGVLYIEHYGTNALDTSSKIIDSYNIHTGVYKCEASGMDASLSNYIRQRYSSSVENGIVTLVDKQTNATHTIDITIDNLFSEALRGLEYNYAGCHNSADRIFLMYRLPNTFWGSMYPHLVCEYNLDTKEISFSSLVFLYDYTTISIVTI